MIDLEAMKTARASAAEAVEEAPAPKKRQTRQAAQEAAGQLPLTLVPPKGKSSPGGAAAASGGAKYQIVLADYPWSYDNKGTRLAPEYAGEQREEKRYETMPNADIVKMGEWVQSVVADDALLFFWVTNNMLLDGHGVAGVRAWGFEPKQLVPWVKVSQSTGEARFGGGNYTRVCSEQMILATRGRATSLIKDKGIAGAILEPGGLMGSFIALRGSKHSKKPADQYELIEKLVGKDVPKLELFGREPRDGWDVMGDQAPIKATF